MFERMLVGVDASPHSAKVLAAATDLAIKSHASVLVAHIREKYKTPGWWTQMVAVGYERIRGLRAHGQKRSGEWSLTKSKTIAANSPIHATRIRLR